ncbi:hypothetical protein ACP70R_011726 [Stipagrostis hirtigluma subsp. patula]
MRNRKPARCRCGHSESFGSSPCSAAAPMDTDMETLADDDAAAALADDDDAAALAEDDAAAAAAAERYEAEAAEADLLRDHLRLSVIKIATAEGRKAGMEVAEPVVACIADLAFKTAEQLAKDVELFAQHAGRSKSVRMEDVILTAHRNEHLMGQLRTFSRELKGKEPASERKKKRKAPKKDDEVIDV